jgi:small GTP-binding protein
MLILEEGFNMSKASIMNDLLRALLNEVPDLFAVLVVDLDGLTIAKQSVQGFNEETIGAIMSIIDQTINKIKRYAETAMGSGTINTDDFQLFYVELYAPALFVLVANPYSNMNRFLPYSYITAERISLILNDRDTTFYMPKLDSDGRLLFTSGLSSNNGKCKYYNIVIIGAETVGKSTLLEMYNSGDFHEAYKPTIGISLVNKELQISKNHKICLCMFDLGGLKAFAKIRSFYYQYSKAVILMFDYSRNETFEKINEWIEEARNFINKAAIFYILIGNKIDLMEDRISMKERAISLAEEYNFKFFETSALTGEGIDEVFTYLASNFLIT